MLDLRRTAALLVFLIPACRGYAVELSAATPAPEQLVREVVYNELHDHRQHGYWRYWIARRLHGETMTEEQVETADGPIARLELVDGRPLSSSAGQTEQARLSRLVASPQEQARHMRQYAQDEERIGRIVALLPDAFLFTFEGEENGRYRLGFRPNPSYPAHSVEARVFHAMSGTLWIDARFKRLAGLEGCVEENVDFGFGILGRLYKGGWFRLERVPVSATDWKTERLEVHMNVRALLVTSFARETSEVRGGFTPVPAGMSMAQGVSLLEQGEQPVVSTNGGGGVTAFAFNR
ncbi:MAG TPA: hypothetical protein VFB43_18250 [Terracidiphilus sp.]|nr:hypothetical protein [Terracidiphilus sp.]